MKVAKKTKLMVIRFTEEDLKNINKIANKNGIWGGTWVRTVILQELVRLGKRKNFDSHIRKKVHGQ